MLSEINAHPRDSRISFEEEDHLYSINGVPSNPTSVTTKIHKCFPKFDASKIIDKMMNSANWLESKYFGMSKEEIIELWEKNGYQARTLGTKMHAQIEDYFNSGIIPEEKSPEFCQFLQFWKDFSELNPGYTPYRTEWCVYSNNLKVAGSIDMVLKGPHGELVIIDWKRSKEIRKENPYSKGFGLFSHLDDCNFNHYSIQLNCYRHILVSAYGKIVSAMYLAIFHPDSPTYQCMQVPMITSPIEKLIDE